MDSDLIHSGSQSMQQALAQAGPAVQVLVSAVVLLAVLGSTWFWSVTLDRLFERLGARRAAGRPS